MAAAYTDLDHLAGTWSAQDVREFERRAGAFDMANALDECHRQLSKFLGTSLEPVEVWRCAEAHRAYWRPEHVRVLLLGESHVYTKPPELTRQVVLPSPMETGVPRAFVRLVYCLGYGENGLLNRPIDDPPNSGTPQFWKIFYSCLNRVQRNEDFAPVLKRTNDPERIANKVALLRRLKEAGVWLLDASLAALYPKPAPRIVKTCIQTSWDGYVCQVVAAASPSHIVCIGKGVAGSLRTRLDGFGIPYDVLPQPNAHLNSKKQLVVFRRYHDIVSRASQGRMPARLPKPQVRHAVEQLRCPGGGKRTLQTHGLCKTVSRVAPGAPVRRWVLREDNHAHVHGVIRLTETPLFLELSWRPTAGGRVTPVGLFRLDLVGLLRGGFIRHDPVNSGGPKVRLRIVRAVDEQFYIRARQGGPGVRLNTSNGEQPKHRR